MKKELSSTMTEINGTLLANALKKRNLNSGDISEQFGYSRSYLNACIRNNAISTSLAELLWNEFNIPLDEYIAHKADMPKTAEPVNADGKKDDEAEQLYQVMRRAYTDAFNDVQGGLFAAVYGAMKKAMREEGR